MANDMLVRLYALPDSRPVYDKMAEQGIRIFRPLAPDKGKVFDFICKTFSPGWAHEIDVAFASHPTKCFIAVDDHRIVGFAGYDCTAPDFFGPLGVDPEYRHRDIGSALLLRCLEALREEGYGYAIIGSVGPAEFYQQVCGAERIENSSPGIYAARP